MYLNDQTQDPPKLKVYLNTGNLTDLPATSSWPGLSGKAAAEQLKMDGFAGIQLDGAETAIGDGDGLPHCGLDRINQVEDAAPVFQKHKENGDSCITLHLGWGMEEDDEIDALLRAVLNATQDYQLPAFIETHRSTITQDMWRTVQMTKRFPEVRFNGDFSHYYCGQEMVYGDFEAKLDFLHPVFERVGFMHGRIAAPGFMQAPIEDPDKSPLMAVGVDYLEHFKALWTRAMAGFKSHAGPGDVLIFAPELLRPDIYYARVIPGSKGRLIEESDRYEQAMLYSQIARDCFESA